MIFFASFKQSICMWLFVTFRYMFMDYGIKGEPDRFAFYT